MLNKSNFKKYIHTYTYIHTHTHTHIYTYIHTHMHTYIHTYIHTHTHTHTHTHIEMSKITAWSRNDEINFNEDKSRFMIISRRKRKVNKEIKVYLNNKPLQQVSTMTYLWRCSQETNLLQH